MKHDLRRVLLTQRQTIPPELRKQYDHALNGHVLDWWKRHPVRSVGVYWPIRGEPDLQPVYAELAKHGVQLALPIVASKDAALYFVKWTPGDPMETGAMNVPIPEQPHHPIFPGALLIPCVGFNNERIRLGYGGGFYDRTLEQKPRPLTVGIVYQQGLVDFDADPHDIALDIILTERAGVIE